MGRSSIEPFVAPALFPFESVLFEIWNDCVGDWKNCAGELPLFGNGDGCTVMLGMFTYWNDTEGELTVLFGSGYWKLSWP